MQPQASTMQGNKGSGQAMAPPNTNNYWDPSMATGGSAGSMTPSPGPGMPSKNGQAQADVMPSPQFDTMQGKMQTMQMPGNGQMLGNGQTATAAPHPGQVGGSMQQMGAQTPANPAALGSMLQNASAAIAPAAAPQPGQMTPAGGAVGGGRAADRAAQTTPNMSAQIAKFQSYTNPADQAGMLRANPGLMAALNKQGGDWVGGGRNFAQMEQAGNGGVSKVDSQGNPFRIR